MASQPPSSETDADFARLAEPFRHELRAHCYRMLGSMEEAEDALQETYLRAWRAYARFEARSSLRVWMYRIATNVCLTALQHAERRFLPSGLGSASEHPGEDPSGTGGPNTWLEPIPDALIAPESEDPSVVAQTRAGVRLALIASLQHLPARQRAVVILRDVIELPAAEVAEMLDTSTTAIKSMLQRARARLAQVSPRIEDLAEPSEAQTVALLNQYIAAFEQGDLSLLSEALHTDAILEMTSSGTWFAGKHNCLTFIQRFLDTAGVYRMLPTRANGQPAVAAYRRAPDGLQRAFALVVLAPATYGIARITLFHDTELFTRFGFPPVIPA